MAEEFPTPRNQQAYNNNRATKICYFHKDGDPRTRTFKVAVNQKKYSTIEALQDDLTNKIDLPFGVRSIYTPMGRHAVRNTEDLQNNTSYICSTHPKKAKGLDVKKLEAVRPWQGGGRPSSGKRALYDLLKQERALNRMKRLQMGEIVSPTTLSTSSEKPPSYLSKSPRTPKRITVMKNGHPQTHHILLINRNTLMSFEQVLQDIGVMFHMPSAKKLYTADGKEVRGLNDIINGPANYVVCGREDFIPLSAIPQPNANVNGKNKRKAPAGDPAKEKLKQKRERLEKTTGHWQVWIKTHDLPTAGSGARVSLTVYGGQGNSGPIILGEDDEECFQPGNEDQFDISVGRIGEIFKIRLAHDDSGDFAGYLCDELRMRDVDTGEELQFTCGRWMSREEEDGEICRELPAVRPEEYVLPIHVYQVMVVTGDVWNAATDANVYITMYGEMGDTGVRQLLHSSNGQKFLKGQTDLFSVEAVSLGEITKVTIGHDGQDAGSGWFLDKITIQESPSGSRMWLFPCKRWLDEGEDDGAIVRDLKNIKEYRPDVFEKQQFEYEKWKLQPNCQVKFFSAATGKVLRLKPDGSLDFSEDHADPLAVFNVILKRGMLRCFQSANNPHLHLAIENGKPTGQGRGGPPCEFKVLVQEDRSVRLQSSKNPSQYLAFGNNGRAMNANDAKPEFSKFFVYCKGMFRDLGIVLLCTSVIQSLGIVDSDNRLVATGKLNQLAQFKVHKVSAGVRMFESIVYPGKFIQCKSGICDVNGKGDKFCQFRIERKKDKGYVIFESLANKSHCLGMTENGTVKPTVFTGAKNMRFCPEVIDFGRMKTEESVVSQSPIPVPIKPLKHKKIPRPKSEDQVSLATTAQVYNDGDWKVLITTAESAVNAEVILMVYGDDGEAGPIYLGTSEDGLFHTGQSDEFKVNLSPAGKIYKIRLELLQAGQGSPSWKVRQVKMKDMNTKETLTFKFNRWLSRTEDDLDVSRELPAVRPSQPVLPVIVYKVEVFTGKDNGADTDANLYIQLFGIRGDSGKRGLVQSENEEMFQPGQVDTFGIEVVDMDQLTHCVIGHDADGIGEGWLCERIIVTNPQSGEHWLFACNKWLDSGLGDGKVERSLKRTDINDDPIPEQNGADEEEWDIWVTTGAESEFQTSTDVELWVYGSEGNSGPLIINYYDENGDFFKAGSTDRTEMNFKNLGELYKIRVGAFFLSNQGSWFLEKIKMKNKNTKQTLIFNCGRWLSLEKDDGETWREMPVILPGKTPLPIVIYTIEIYTGTVRGASTSATVYVHLFGSRGDSGQRELNCSATDHPKWFRTGQMDAFEIEAVSLEELESVVLEHDANDKGKGWFVDKVIIKEGRYEDIKAAEDNLNGPQKNGLKKKNKDQEEESQFKKWFFPCQRWLDAGQDDGEVKRELKVAAAPKLEPTPPSSDKTKRGDWNVLVTSGKQTEMASQDKIRLWAYGDRDTVGPIPLGEDDPDQYYRPGATDKFKVNLKNVGNPYKIRIGYDPDEEEEDLTNWFIDKIVMNDLSNNEKLTFKVQRWLSRQQEDHDTWRELPVVRPGKQPLPIVIYTVEIHTGDIPGSDTDAKAYIQLFGTRGDSGQRTLVKEVSGNLDLFQLGQIDVFEVEAVSLDDLQKVVIGHQEHAKGAGWYVKKVVIKESSYENIKAVEAKKAKLKKKKSKQPPPEEEDFRIWYFPCDCWLDEGMDDGVIERELLTDDMPDDGPPPPEGNWKLTTVTGPKDDMSLRDNEVLLYVYGSRGKSDPIPVGKEDQDKWFQPGAKDDFNITLKKLGEIYKVRIGYVPEIPDDQWYLEKLTLEDVVDKEVLNFEVEKWLSQQHDDCDTWRELPAVHPGKQPLPVITYTIEVYTGNEPGAGTEAQPYIHLFGSRGDSGRRLLFKEVTGIKKPFEAGTKAIFELQAVDLDSIEKMVVGHDGHGKGAGWYCEKVLIKEGSYEEIKALEEGGADENTNNNANKTRPYRAWEFPVNAWMDEGVGDGKLEVEVEGHPMEEEEEEEDAFSDMDEAIDEAPDLLMAEDEEAPDENWQATIVTGKKQNMALEQSEVMLYVYGEEGVSEPIPLGPDEREKCFQAGAKDNFNIKLDEIGEIYKIRIGYEPALPEDGWFLEKVNLKHFENQDELNFKAGRWLSQSEEDCDTWREFPAVYPGKEPLPIVVYTVEVYTGNKPGSDTEAQAYVQLMGKRGDSGCRLLYNELTKNDQKFQQGQMDVFEVEAVTLEDVTSVLLGHTSHGKGAGWYLEKVIVKEGNYETVKALDEKKKKADEQKKNPKSKDKKAAAAKKGKKDETKEDDGPGYRMWYFPCDRWFDEGMEDGLIERILEPGEAPVVEEVGPDGNWQVTVVTGPDGNMALKQNEVLLYVYGSRKVSDPIPLGKDERDKYFLPSASDIFNISLQELGEIYKIRVGYFVEEPEEGWFLEKVILKHIENEDELHFKSERWLSQSQEDYDTWREFPAIYPGKDPLPIVIYTVEIYTGNLPGSDTSAEAYIHLNGSRGDSGQRLLYKELSSNKKPFQQGQVDIYEIEAVSLDEVESVIVGHNGSGKGAGWYIDHVTIKEGRYEDIKAIDDKKQEDDQKKDSKAKKGKDAKGKKDDENEEQTYKMWYFPCARWFDEGMDDGKIERMLTPGDPPREAGPDGNWEVTVVTGPEENMALKQNEVLLYVYGSRKISDPMPLGKEERDQYFHPGAMDYFNISLDELGEIYKIRVGYFAEIKDEEWYLEKVTLKHLENQDELHFDAGRWLSQSKEDLDTWRELPAVHPGKEPLPILIYTVEVYTGNEPGSETEAEAYIQLYGSRGDTGRRLLYREMTANKKPYQRGQMDIYEVEAVSIDEVEAVLLGHNGEGKGAGWFVDHVIVKEGSYEQVKAIDEKKEQGEAAKHDEKADKNVKKKSNKKKEQKANEDTDDYRMWYFPCSRWFDTGMDDKEIERILKPGNPPEEKKREDTIIPIIEEIVEETPPTEGARLWVKTAEDSKAANNSRMILVVYGDKGRSEDMILHKDGAFAAGNTDDFDLELEEVGEPYKIRVERDNDDEWEGWHLEQVKLQTSEGQEYIFEFDRWMDRSQDDHDIVRELPFKKDEEEPLPMQHYEVTIFTGDHWAAVTDAKAYMTLFGSRGDSGKRWLYHTESNETKFMKNQVDSFIVEAVTLENLEKIEIGHIGTGFGAGWYIDKVVIKEKYGEKTNMEYIFPCGRWFDDQIGDKLTCRTLYLKDEIDSTAAPNSLEDEPSTGEWKVTIKTSDLENAGTKAQAFITACGDSASSEPQPLGNPGNPDFDQDKEAQFTVQFGDIGEIEKIRLEHDNTGDSPDWHVEKIILQDTKTKEEFTIYVDQWFSEEQEDGMTCREFQISKPLAPTKPSLLYQIAILTGEIEEAGTTAEVSMNIVGEYGETGFRKLTKSLTCSEPFKPGQTDVFHLDAVHLGRLDKVLLKHDGKTPETKWLVEKVIIKETVWAVTQAVFNCSEWVMPSKDPENVGHSILLTDMEFATDLPPYEKGEQPPKSSGEWKLWTHTSEDQGTDVDAAVSIVIFGTKGESTPIPLKPGKTEDDSEEKDQEDKDKRGKDKKSQDKKKKDKNNKGKGQENYQEKSDEGDDKLKAGAVDEFNLSCGDIGEVYKIRILLDSKGKHPEWFIKKLKMKDDQTGQEFHFFYNDWVKANEENPDGMVELPAIWPDIKPLEGAKYTLFVATGDEPRADTEAEVTCTLVGSYGDTGPRQLKTSKSNEKPFSLGQVDEFDLQAVDIGPIKKVILCHKSQGRGNGWLCERLSIRCDLSGDQEFIFPIHSWIDTGCQNRLMQQEFNASTSVKIESEKPTGPWKCSIVMASEEDLKAARERNANDEKTDEQEDTPISTPNVTGVGLAFIGDKGEPDLMKLPSEDPDAFALGKTSEHEITTEDVGQLSKIRVATKLDDSGPHLWLVEKVTLTDQGTKEVIVLDFKEDIGKEVTVVERPVPKAATNLPAVLDYQVKVHLLKEEQAENDLDKKKQKENKEPNDSSEAKQPQPLSLRIVGENGDSGFVPIPGLQNVSPEPLNVINMVVSAVDLGCLEKICLIGKSEEYIPEKITILPKEFASNEYIFYVGKLDEEEVTEVKPSQKLPHPVAVPVEEAPEELPKSEGTWKVKTITGKEKAAGATGQVVVVLCGYSTESDPMPLTLPKGKAFQPGAEEEFEIKVDPTLDIFKVRLGFKEEEDTAGKDKKDKKAKKDAEKEEPKTMSWFVEKMHFEDTVTHDWFELEINDWIRLDETSDGWKEFPIQWPAVKLPSVQKYEVHVKTADIDNADTLAMVYLNIIGNQGMTGKRILKKSNKKILFQRGQIDVFELEAVDLVDPVKVIVGHNLKDAGAGWLLENIVIKKKGDEDKEFIFKNNRWLDAEQDDQLIERELEVSPPEPPPENNWRLIITTSDMERASTDAPVTITVFGDKGDTGPTQLEGEGKFQRGATDDFEIHIDEEKVGKISKIRIQHSDSTAEADMHLSKVELESLDGKTTVEFPPLDRWLSSSDDDGDVVRELPAIWPDDSEPKKVTKYSVEIHTGDESRAPADSKVFVTLFGENGDSGKRYLNKNKEDMPKFDKAKEDLFSLEAVDLGPLQKVIIGYDQFDENSGWQCNKVVIKESEDSQEQFVGTLDKWLDNESEDGLTEREIYLKKE